jgi:hypothetical protein
MELHEFPRPPQDNGRGVHWSLSVYEWGKSNWNFWAEQLQAMKIKWVKIMDDGGGSGLPVARRLVDLGIMPVVRFYWMEQNPGNIGDRGAKAVKRYLDVGAFYFETNNEPDLDLEWKGGTRPPNWLDIVVGDFIANADIILNLGGYPAMPAFGVGTLRDPFAKMVERGRRDILDNGAWAAIHNYCLARPLEYPNDPVNTQGVPITEEEWQAAGGTWAWEMSWEEVNKSRKALANPNADIMQDATCFRGFELLNAYIVKAIGHSIPIMTTEGGYNVGQRAGTTAGDDPRYPKPTPLVTGQLNLELFKYMQGEREILGQKVPDYYFACMPWLIAAQSMGIGAPPAENQGPWFTHKYDAEWGLNGELPLVQMLKDLPSHVRQDGPVHTQWQKSPTPDKLGRNWDVRLNYLGAGVKLSPAPATGGPTWKLVEAKWLNEKESGGGRYILVKALGRDGNPLENAAFVVGRPGARDVVRTKGAPDGFWGNYTMYGLLGTYTVEMTEGDHPSEQVTGVGMGTEEVPNAWNNTSFRFTFQLVENVGPAVVAAGETQPVTVASTTSVAADETQPVAITSLPPVAAGPSEADKQLALRRAVLEAAESRSIPANPDSTLYKYARQHALGEPVSLEFTLDHEGVSYTAQAYAKGVVYAPTGRPDQVAHVESGG